jgi:hypothetical protein
LALTEIGRIAAGEGINVTAAGVPVALDRTGWRHG